MRTGESLLVLRERNFAWFFASRFVNLTGTTMAGVAVAFAVLEVSGSASALGQVLAARTIPMVVFLLVGGVIADRLPRVLVIQVSNAVAFLTQGAMAVLVIGGHAQLWHLVLLQLLNGTGSAASLPAMQGLIPQLVPRARLQPANVLLSSTRGLLAVVGPSVSAVLVVTAGPGWALAVDSLAWLVAAALLLPVRIPPRDAVGRQAGFVRDLLEGWDVFRRTTWLWVVVAAFAVLNAIHAGAILTIGPVLAKDTFGERGWGLAMSAEAVGLLLMSLVLLKVSLRFPLRAGMLGMLALVVPLVAIGLQPSTTVAVVSMVIAGAGMQVFGLGWSLAMQENVPEEKLSRAYSYDMLGSFAAMPVGQLLYGPLGEVFGYRQVLVASGVVYALVCLAALAVPAVRALRRAQEAPAAG